MSVTTEDVHVALGVNDADVAIAGRWFGASNQAKFIFVVLRSIMVVPKLLPLLHLMVILVKALVSVLDDEGIHHCNGGRSTKVVSLGVATLADSP